MALTIKEQLDIITGVVTPNDSSYTLEQIVEQVAFNYAQDFITNQIVIDANVYPDGWTYQYKILSVSNILLSGKTAYLPALTKAVVAKGADNGIYSQVVDLNTNGWETFVTNNIELAIEQIAGVTPAEKTEYGTIN